LRLDLEHRPSHARASFVISASNQAAVAAVDAWPLWPGGKLALIGPAGTGKTHLARAWAAKAGARIVETEEVPGAAGPLLIEDADRHVAEDLLFHLVNRADSGATLLITGRTPPGSWPTLLPDLRSRLNALTVASINSPDDEVLLGIMEKLFIERNIRPKPGVAAYAIKRIERSAPAVQDLVHRIDEWAGGEKREVTLSLVRHLLHLDGDELE
jgi:chromosomal replication initiation ATPase DnaA